MTRQEVHNFVDLNIIIHIIDYTLYIYFLGGGGFRPITLENTILNGISPLKENQNQYKLLKY